MYPPNRSYPETCPRLRSRTAAVVSAFCIRQRGTGRQTGTEEPRKSASPWLVLRPELARTAPSSQRSFSVPLTCSAASLLTSWGGHPAPGHEERRSAVLGTFRAHRSHWTGCGGRSTRARRARHGPPGLRDSVHLKTGMENRLEHGNQEFHPGGVELKTPVRSPGVAVESAVGRSEKSRLEMSTRASTGQRGWYLSRESGGGRWQHPWRGKKQGAAVSVQRVDGGGSRPARLWISHPATASSGLLPSPPTPVAGPPSCQLR